MLSGKGIGCDGSIVGSEPVISSSRLTQSEEGAREEWKRRSGGGGAEPGRAPPPKDLLVAGVGLEKHLGNTHL